MTPCADCFTWVCEGCEHEEPVARTGAYKGGIRQINYEAVQADILALLPFREIADKHLISESSVSRINKLISAEDQRAVKLARIIRRHKG